MSKPDLSSLLKGSKVVFKLDNEWCIVKEGGDVFMGCHTDCKFDFAGSWFSKESPRCHYCGAPVPEEIQALIHLQVSL